MSGIPSRRQTKIAFKRLIKKGARRSASGSGTTSVSPGLKFLSPMGHSGSDVSDKYEHYDIPELLHGVPEVLVKDDNKGTVQLRSRPDNVKLFEGMLTHLSKMSLIQYALSGTFVYLYFTNAFRDLDTKVDLLGLKFKLSIWITAAPLVYALLNFHMCRVMKQMTRLLRRDRQNAALMAIMAVQSVWFGNPFHNAASKSFFSMCAVFYSITCLALPFFGWGYLAVTILATEIPRQVPGNGARYLLWGVGACNVALLLSVLALWDIGFDQCRIQVRKALFRPALGPPSGRVAVRTASRPKDSQERRSLAQYMGHLFRLLTRPLTSFLARRRRD
jgi:hypothetical protein